MTLTQRQVGVPPSQPTIHILFPVCALYFIFGVVCAFFGYRCFKAIMFLYGFIFGSIVVYLICAEEEVLPGIINTSITIVNLAILLEWSNAAIAVSAGLLFGLITMLVQYVGLFMLGFHTGQQTKITNNGNSGRRQGIKLS